jgi:positive regulator of sigma E activity
MAQEFFMKRAGFYVQAGIYAVLLLLVLYLTILSFAQLGAVRGLMTLASFILVGTLSSLLHQKFQRRDDKEKERDESD